MSPNAVEPGTRLVDRYRDTLEFEVALAPVAAERRALRWSTLAPARAMCA